MKSITRTHMPTSQFRHRDYVELAARGGARCAPKRGQSWWCMTLCGS